MFKSIHVFTALCTTAAIGLSPAAQGQSPTAVVVGTQTLELRDATRNRAVVSEMWFEAEAGSVEQGFSLLPPIAEIPLARGARPAATVRARPLIVISHGNWSTRYGHGILARELVKAGYGVLSVSHPGTMNGDLSLEGRTRLWERALDVSFALTQVLASTNWAPTIDANRIGFVGHSFGGFAGVLLAGGRWDAPAQRSACEQLTPKDQYCQNLLEAKLEGISMQGMGDSYFDPRFKSFYIMGSGPAGGFSSATLSQIKAPFFVDTAKLDDVLEPKGNSTRLAQLIPNTKEVVREVGHFTYAPLCKPVIGKLLAAQVCTDPKGVDRAELHKAVHKDAMQFFKANLQ